MSFRARDHEERASIIASRKLPPVGSFSSSKAQDTVVNGHDDNHLTDAKAFFNRRIIEFVKKRVALMGEVLNAEYHLDDQDIPANRSNGGVEPGEGPKTSYQKPQPTFVPYPTPLTPEEVLGRALDNDPKRLKVPAYYNEVVFVSPFAKLCLMISENRLDAFQTYAGNKSAGIRLRRFSRLEPRLESSDQLQQQLPGCKWGHTCNAVRNLIYIFGGCGRDECQTNDVHVFDIGTHTWSKPVMKGTHPSPRDSHSSMAVGSKLYVFGGTDGSNPPNDLFVLDTATNTWGKPDVFGDVPAPKEGHSALLIGDNLFVFGGCGKSSDPSEEEYYNDLHVLNANTFVWKKISITGVSPIPRDSHTCSSYKNCFIVMGGEDGGNAYLNDVHILDTETMAWREVKTTGAELMPRAEHTTISHGKYLVVFGGFSDDRKLFNDVHTLDLSLDDMYFLLLLTLLPFLTIWLAFFCEEMLREKDPSEPKLSMRKELKRRRQEYRAMPFVLDKQRDADKSLVSSLGEFQAHVQPLGKKMFEARVSDVFNYGYTLEASIDGKLFRGLLFSYKPGFAQAVQSYMASIFARRLVQDLKLNNILSKLNMRNKVVISTFRRYHNSKVHGS
ncbi:hypothetical protein SELMODRAFT_424453 [Selaginella moellendorffii]|uniref:DCD domain-containing protein n=1 Tax=Selaginella moellendorffii TaxID=88036 RepID=D8SPY0_SELML|nr:hypothetical protein SELMODRAFT_424453 [Selaginella moellendorffii]